MEEQQESVVQEKKESKWQKIVLSIVVVFLAVFTVLILLYSILFYHVTVVGSSMSPTLKNGDVLLVSKHYKVERGDIVIVKDETASGNLLIKRAVALGGDTVTIMDGYLFINGKKQIEEYLLVQGETFYPDVTNRNDTKAQTWQVKEGQVFYLGDNRKNSNDSRYEEYGTCSLEQIDGVVKDWVLNFKGISKGISNFISGVRKIFTFN